MRNTFYLAAGFTAALLIIGGVNCAGDKYDGVPEDEVVARVGDRVLTAADLDEMDRLQRLRKAPKYLTKEELLDDWVRSEIIYQEALKRELHKDPEIEKALTAAEKSILIQMFWQKYVYDVNPEPDDEGALEYYEKIKDRDYKAGTEMYWLLELAVADAGAVGKVESELAEGKEFESVARGHSILPNKTKGGNMGYVKLSNIPPKAAEAIEAAALGDTVGPIEMGQFIYYYKIEDRIGPGEYLKPESLDMAYLRDKAKVGTWAEEAGRLGEELYAEADIETHPENINTTTLEMVEGAGSPIGEEKE